MAIREYIGARYVPIFVGAWDNTRTYEPLMIVTYQGNSFTSKKYVPAGIALTNEDYWAESGNFSQQVEQLRQEIGQANQDIAGLEQDVDALQLATNANTSMILRTKFYGQKSIGFGDSNMYGQTGISENQCIYKKICDRLGCTYDNRGVNGATFALVNTQATSPTIQTQLDNATADPDVKLVVFIGGINDYHYTDYNYSSTDNTGYLFDLRACMVKAIAKFPNAEFLMIWDQGQQFPNSRMLRYAQGMSELKRSYPTKILHVPVTYDIAYGGSTYFYNQNHYNDLGTTWMMQRALDTIIGNQPSKGFCFRGTYTSPLNSGIKAGVSLVPVLESYGVMQQVALWFPQQLEIPTAYTEIFTDLPVGIGPDPVVGESSFYETCVERRIDGTFFPLYLTINETNKLTTNDESPKLRIRNANAFTHPQGVNGTTFSCEFMWPLFPHN